MSAPGDRVRLLHPVGFHACGDEGVVVDLPVSSLNGHDMAVRFDGDAACLCVDADEIELIPTT